MKRQDYNYLVLILVVSQLIGPSLEYSKVAAVGTIQLQPQSNQRMTVRHYPFHYSHTELSNPLHAAAEEAISKKLELKQEKIWKNDKKSQIGLNSFNVDQDEYEIKSSEVNSKNTPLNSIVIVEKKEEKQKEKQVEKTALKVLGDSLGEKLVTFVEQRINKRFLKPWRNAVAVTKQLFDKWEEGQRSEEGRQGGSSISDMLDYGWDQVSKLRDSYQSLWPPSGELAHRHEGAYSHGHGHYASSHGDSSGDSGLDTFALLAALAFAAYLLQLLMTLTSTTARALDRSVSDWLPTSLLTTDFEFLPNFLKNAQEAIESSNGVQRMKREAGKQVESVHLQSTENKLMNGNEIECENLRRKLRWTGKVDFIIKNAKCPPT